MTLKPLAPAFCPCPILCPIHPNGSTPLQSFNHYLTSIICGKPSLKGDFFDSSIDDIPQTSDDDLTLPTPIVQQTLTQQLPHRTTSFLYHEHLSLQHQLTQCLDVTHKTIRKLRQALKTMNLDQKAVQFLTLHIQNQFTLLHYL